IDNCPRIESSSPYRTGCLVPVQEFLSELVGDQCMLSDVFDGFKVSFSHFVNMNLRDGAISNGTDFLEDLLFRCAAAIFQRDQPGADLVIPMIKEDAENVQVSCIYIQVKRWYSPNTDSTKS